MNVRPILPGESREAYERRVEAAERQTHEAENLRAYMKQKMTDTLEKMKNRIRIVETNEPERDVCPTCDGHGVIRYDVPLDDERFGHLYPCPNPSCTKRKADRQQYADAILRQSGVPGSYREMTFETWVQIPNEQRNGKHLAAGAAWVWANNLKVSPRAAAKLYEHPDSESYQDIWKPWLVLQGDLGLGKTGLAAAATNALAAGGHQPVFYRLQEMFGEIQSHYGENETGRNADEIISRIQRAPVLILDECNVPGTSASNDKARLMEEIIRYRHSRQLPTLMTLNADQKLFTQQWGVRTADVVFNSAHWIPLTGMRLRSSDKPLASF